MVWLEGIAILAALWGSVLAIGRFVVWVENREDRGELALKKSLRIDTQKEMGGAGYLWALATFSVLVGAMVFLTASLQGVLPLNPARLGNLPLLQALHLAVAVLTHTNWQPFAPETQLSFFTQNLVIGPANVLMGAVEFAAWRALVRALGRKSVGNAFVGLWRGIFVIVVLQFILAVILTTQGAPGAVFGAGSLVSGAGPGWDSEGFSGVGQNPTYWSNLAALMMFVGIPFGFCLATGRLIKREALMRRLMIAVGAVLAIFTLLTQLSNMAAPESASLGPIRALWTNTVAGSANGMLNTPLEVFSPAGRLGPFFLLLTGAPIPPHMGIGVAMLLINLLIALYLCALMVGRSPDFLGFKVRLHEIAITAAGVLGPQLLVLLGVAVVLHSQEGFALLAQHGARGASAFLWMLGSCAQNNGSSFALPLTSPFMLQVSMTVMALARLLTIGSIVFLSGRLARQRFDTPQSETFHTAGPTVIIFALAVILLSGAMTMTPILALGPLLEAIP